MLRDLMFAEWVPVVVGELNDAGGFPMFTIEYNLQRFHGEPPDRGHPPDWPEAAYVIEREVVRLPDELRQVVIVEFGLVRDGDGYRLNAKQRSELLHMSRAKYHQLVYAAQSALWQNEEIRKYCLAMAA